MKKANAEGELKILLDFIDKLEIFPRAEGLSFKEMRIQAEEWVKFNKEEDPMEDLMEDSRKEKVIKLLIENHGYSLEGATELYVDYECGGEIIYARSYNMDVNEIAWRMANNLSLET